MSLGRVIRAIGDALIEEQIGPDMSANGMVRRLIPQPL
jgi:hypothetical protein